MDTLERKVLHQEDSLESPSNETEAQPEQPLNASETILTISEVLGLNEEQKKEFDTHLLDALRRAATGDTLFRPWDNVSNEVQRAISIMDKARDLTMTELLKVIEKEPLIENVSDRPSYEEVLELQKNEKEKNEARKDFDLAINAVFHAPEVSDEDKQKLMGKYRTLLIDYIMDIDSTNEADKEREPQPFTYENLKTALFRLMGGDTPHASMAKPTALVYDAVKRHQSYLSTLSEGELRKFLQSI